ncbi:MAG: protease pro-enzyme activation domain-containing protein [Candidatus Sulfotelmatobacter sp.]
MKTWNQKTRNSKSMAPKSRARKPGAPWVLGTLAIAGLTLALAIEGIPQLWARTGEAGKPILINQPIDEGRLIRLWANTRPEANAQNDRGRVEDSFPMEHMLLQLKRAPSLEKEFDRYIDSLTDKSSPNFHQWMLAAEQGEKYGLAHQDLDSIRRWLESYGFTADYVYPNQMVIDFSGTAGEIRKAFHTEIHYLEVRGEQHIANMSDPYIPAALAPAVVGVVSLHNFRPQQMRVPRVRTNYTFAGCTAGTDGTGGNCYSLVPGDFETIYNLNPLYQEGINGTGQTITVVEDSDTYSNDVATYRSTFLSKWSGAVTTVHPTGSHACTDPGTNAADGEADLDAEVASAIAPNATIEMATCADSTTTFGGLLAIENLVNSATPPAIISQSYGVCEAANYLPSNAAFNAAFQTAAAAGVSVFVSAGDAGPSGCAQDFTNGEYYAYPGIGVTGWGETVYNVSVGGTDFEDAYNASKANPAIPLSTYWNSTNTGVDGSAKSYIPEIPWNDSCAGYLLYDYEGYAAPYGTAGFCNSTLATRNDAFLSTGAGGGGPSGCATGSGGTDQTSYLEVNGTCAGYAKPSWQSGIFGNPADGVRDVPDVSLFASNGIWGHYVTVCFSDTANEGTSCAGAPSTWAGFGGTSVATPMMAAIQALVNEKWGTSWQGSGAARSGNPNPIYYQIANAEFGSSGNSSCYSINQPPRRGLASSCAFYDITQGDNDVDCKFNGTLEAGCYLPSSTYGVVSTQALATISVTAGGSGYTSAPTCTLGAPATSSAYLNPAGGTIYGGGTHAGTCTATINAGSTTAVGTLVVSAGPATSWAGASFTVGSTTYTFVTGTPSAANQIELYTASTAATNETDTARQIEAVLDDAPADCVTAGCVYTGQTANTSVTATAATNTVTLTAKTAGAAGNFTIAVQNNATSDLVAAITTVGAGPGYVASITGPTGGAGAGYAGGSGCSLTGGGGSGATCAAEVSPTTAPASYAPAYGATPGWDFATGIGSVNAYNLVFSSVW